MNCIFYQLNIEHEIAKLAQGPITELSLQQHQVAHWAPKATMLAFCLARTLQPSHARLRNLSSKTSSEYAETIRCAFVDAVQSAILVESS
jgi:hypothetical protein